MTKAVDCEYMGFCVVAKKFIVREQLYPESRGWISHKFESEEEALGWLKKITNLP